MSESKPIAKLDYTYCINKKCKERLLCARYFRNYKMRRNTLYSFCLFDSNNCIELEEHNGYKRVTETNKEQTVR